MSTAETTVTVRRAIPPDGPAILRLVEALADYEQLTPPDDPARERLLRDTFCERPRIDVFLAEFEGEPIGYAIVFETYSSFLAMPTLYLEDLFVLPEHRGRGAGKLLLAHCIGEAERRGCGRMEWQVLDWNTLARDFYERLDARHLSNWCVYRLTRDQFSTVRRACQRLKQDSGD